MTEHVVVTADGGSRGNPGPAGYGAVVLDARTGEVLREVAAGIGVATNNVAEYRGLIAGLTAALDAGARRVDVRMDSLLVVNQMKGVWKVKHEAMQPLAREAAALVRRFDLVTWTHVPREQNKYADRLANEAMDAAAAGRTWVRREAAAVPAAEAAATADGAGERRLYGWSAPPGPATVALLLRHGETAHSVDKRFSGSSDPELTARGRAQADAAARRLAALGVTAVVTSPRRRARQTAEAVAAACGAAVHVDDDLAETDFGAWEGRTLAEIRDVDGAALRRWLADPDVAPPGGESFTATFARVQRARDRVVAAHPGAVVAVVAHVTPIKALIRQALDAPPHALFHLHLDPASLSAVDWYADGSGVVRLVNDTGHLAAERLGTELPTAAR